MNSINLIGNICADLEVKQTNSGKSVVQFNLAVKRPFTQDTTDFIPVVAWNQTAEFLGKYAKKGSKVAVTGKLTARNYEDKNGNKRTAYEVVADAAELCGGKTDAEQAQTAKGGGSYIPDAYTKPQGNFEEMKPDDDLPF